MAFSQVTFLIIACLIHLVLVIMHGLQSDQKITLAGDIIIGGLFPVHKEGKRENECGELNDIPGYQYMEAMLYALEKINNNTDILPGIKLGTVIYDTCRSPTITADKTKEFIKMTLISKENNSTELAGVIGPFVSGNSVIVANFLRVFQIPQISYGSLSVQLSNKRLYNYFFRTVPPDSFFARALAALIDHLGWDYVSIIGSTGTYSETGTKEVEDALGEKDICVATKLRLPRFPTEKDYTEAIDHVLAAEKANVVILVTIQRDARALLKAKQRQPLAKRLQFLGSVSWSNRDDVTNGLGDVADGSITFGHQEGNNEEFENYFRLLNLSNYKANYKGWFEELWQKQFGCFLGNSSDKYSTQCSGNESLLEEHMEIAPVRVTINAVYAMAYALHNMHQHLCPNQTKLCSNMLPLSRVLLTEFLKNVSFPDSTFHWPIQFDSNNEVLGNYTVLNFRKTQESKVYSYIPVGTWTSSWLANGKISGELKVNFSDIYWTTENNTTPSSKCSSPCDDESVEVFLPGQLGVCCWECEPCARYDIIINNTCQSCDTGYVPEVNLTVCSKLPLKYVNLNTPVSLFLFVTSCLGILADIIVFTVFLVKKDNEVISCLVMFGLLLVFLVPCTLLLRPTQILCDLRKFLIALSFIVIYCPLLVKIRADYLTRIYDQRKKPASHDDQQPSLVTPSQQVWLTLGLSTLGFLLCLVTSINNRTLLQEAFFRETEELFLECSTTKLFIVNFFFVVIIIIPCTGYAFLARNTSREAVYTGITVSITNVFWVVFLACFVNTTSRGFLRLYLLSAFYVLIGWITLVGLFVPKIWQLKKSVAISSVEQGTE